MPAPLLIYVGVKATSWILAGLAAGTGAVVAKEVVKKIKKK